jgi:RNA polymerase sigma-70 factor (ECF subfamily)
VDSGPVERRGSPDEDWLAALRAERDDAWALLREKIRIGLLAYVRENVRHTERGGSVDNLVEDATQETLITVRAKFDTFRYESRFTTWVYRIAVNVVLGQLRRRRWERQGGKLSSSLPDRPFEDQAPSPEREASMREVWSFVRGVIEHELTPHQRTIILAHTFDQKPLDLVAADLGISRDAAYKAIHDARRKLRAALLARGLTLDQVRDIFGA